MEALTHQEIFDRAVTGVIKQGALSQMNGGRCRYRATKKGKTLACGVGQVIADDLYTKVFENCGVDRAIPSYDGYEDRQGERLMLALLFSGVDVTTPDTLSLLVDLQNAHDGSRDVAEFVRKATRLASDRKLNTRALATQGA